MEEASGGLWAGQHLLGPAGKWSSNVPSMGQGDVQKRRRGYVERVQVREGPMFIIPTSIPATIGFIQHCYMQTWGILSTVRMALMTPSTNCLRNSLHAWQ